MALKDLGEFGLINEIRRSFPVPEGMTGIGDDCAVIPQSSGLDTLVSTDMLMEGSHFLLEDVDPYRLGWKSAAVNFSDIAAMGGSPVGSFLAFALPKSLPSGWVDEFMKGYGDISRKYSFPLLGGDTTSSPDRLGICVTVLGSVPSGEARMRSMAMPGDLVCVTGNLGDSGAGLKVILDGLERGDDEDALVARHYLPEPQMLAGVALRQTAGVHAMMDISDGIGSDLRHIIEESGVGAEIDVESIPLSKELRRFCDRYDIDPYKLATGGGEDYQLLYTVSPEATVDVPHHVIGRITKDGGLVWKGADKDYQGFRHF